MAGWPAEAYVLVGREDIAATRMQRSLAVSTMQTSASAIGKAMDVGGNAEAVAVPDGALGDLVPEVARAVGLGVPPGHALASPNARTPVLGESCAQCIRRLALRAIELCVKVGFSSRGASHALQLNVSACLLVVREGQLPTGVRRVDA